VTREHPELGLASTLTRQSAVVVVATAGPSGHGGRGHRRGVTDGGAGILDGQWSRFEARRRQHRQTRKNWCRICDRFRVTICSAKSADG